MEGGFFFWQERAKYGKLRGFWILFLHFLDKLDQGKESNVKVARHIERKRV